jgi:type I restriction enzyme M protein
MSLTLQELKSHLWMCAEILRGSAVDRTDWKAYILPLLFFKRLAPEGVRAPGSATSVP